MLDETTTIITNDIPEEAHYVAETQDGWGIAMTNTEADDGSDLDHAGVIGLSMTNFKIGSSKIKQARVRNKRGKWLPYKTGFENPLGDGTDITGIEIVGSGFVFAVHVKGGQWLGSNHTSNNEGEVLVTTGTAIDAIWIDKA